MALWNAGVFEIVSSEVLLLEANRIPSIKKKQYLLEQLKEFKPLIKINDNIQVRANYFQSINIKPIDALHLATAESLPVDYFCTCDDKFLRKAKLLDDLQTIPVSPLELVEKIDV